MCLATLVGPILRSDVLVNSGGGIVCTEQRFYSFHPFSKMTLLLSTITFVVSLVTTTATTACMTSLSVSAVILIARNSCKQPMLSRVDNKMRYIFHTQSFLGATQHVF